MTVTTSKYRHCKMYIRRGSAVCAVITQENMTNNEGIIVLYCLEGMILGFTIPVRHLSSKPVGMIKMCLFHPCLQILATMSLLQQRQQDIPPATEGPYANKLTAS